MSETKVKKDKEMVTDRSVRAVAEHCPELQFVGFMGCPVTSQGVIHLTALRNLNVLDLRHISELNNETVMEVVRKCRNLSSLNLCLNWSINDSPQGIPIKTYPILSRSVLEYLSLPQFTVPSQFSTLSHNDDYNGNRSLLEPSWFNWNPMR
ncbi:F-box/LRR-repeat protein 17 [Collichthys lucidus]|uniref:F-box/LRR-repeat protein 17 n=1 Tax=Collichthys lucidus TaxID=240159 RepID=A0A4U5UWV2_COLLU|nr:F-box/LRR-repeat protein 17 [Collichthys lucidus]